MGILYVKAFHIVGFVAWFAGLFYWLRILVYLSESYQKEAVAKEILSEQFSKMERRVYNIIVVPGTFLTFGCGILMLILNPGYLTLSWLQIKLVLLVLLLAFQFYTNNVAQKIKEGPKLWSPEKLRLLNEVPTVFLLVIVLLAVFRNNINALAAFGITVTFIIGLVAGVKYYKSYRAKNPNH